MLQPWIGLELAKDRVSGLHAEAARDGRVRRSGTTRRREPRGSLRLSLGLRLVSAGYRLLGDAGEVR